MESRGMADLLSGEVGHLGVDSIEPSASLHFPLGQQLFSSRLRRSCKFLRVGNHINGTNSRFIKSDG